MAQDEDPKDHTGPLDVSSAYRSFPTSIEIVACSELRNRPKKRFETCRCDAPVCARLSSGLVGLGPVHGLPFG
jgi:hypothetical protein